MGARVRTLAGLTGVLLLVLLTGGPMSAGAAAPVPVPLLSAPPDGLRGHALWDSYHELEPFGYEEAEYFVSGTATDAGGATAPYTTRIIVTRPTDADRFNGAVMLDWVNVTAQFENAVDTMLMRETLLREGFAYVHVSAQAAGICCLPELTPKTWDPVRYAALDHPGDAFAEDMFTQVARAFEAPGAGLDPMGGLPVERVLAVGQSQSANRLSGYLETFLPSRPEAVGVIDGFLVHGNVPGRKDFAGAAPVPVLHLLSDYEAVDDGVDPAAVGPRYRLWEVAGTGHGDYWTGYQSVFGHGPRVVAGAPKQTPEQLRATLEGAGNYGEVVTPFDATCFIAGAAMPMHYAASTALHVLDRWVAGGGAPDNGPRFAFAGGQLATDADGNTLGGIRLPPIDVPVARYASTACALSGITVPFLDTELVSRYGTHRGYYDALAARSDEAVAAGFLLPVDAVDLMRRACAAAPRFGGSADCPPYVPPAFDQPLPAAGSSAEPVGASGPPVTGVVAAGGRTLPSTGASWLLAPVAPLALLAGLLVCRRVGPGRRLGVQAGAPLPPPR